MPKILERCKNQLKAKGKNTSNAFAICTHSLQKAGDLKKGTHEATEKGMERGEMTPEEREETRKVFKKPKKLGHKKKS